MTQGGLSIDALAHFEALGYSLPSKTNPSDFFLDVITLDQRTPEAKAASMHRITTFCDAWSQKKLHKP